MTPVILIRPAVHHRADHTYIKSPKGLSRLLHRLEVLYPPDFHSRGLQMKWQMKSHWFKADAATSKLSTQVTWSTRATRAPVLLSRWHAQYLAGIKESIWRTHTAALMGQGREIHIDLSPLRFAKSLLSISKIPLQGVERQIVDDMYGSCLMQVRPSRWKRLNEKAALTPPQR